MNTEERITARDSAAPSTGDVVREGREHLTRMTPGEWVATGVFYPGAIEGDVLAGERGMQFRDATPICRVTEPVSYNEAKRRRPALDALQAVGRQREAAPVIHANAHAIAWMRNNLADILNRLTTAEASASTTLARAELAERRVRDAYLAGFKASGEGWNGEYPFEGRAPDHPAWQRIRDDYAKWAALTEATPEDGAVPVNMLVDADWLRRKAESDPDTDCEATSPNQDSHDGR